MEAITDYIRANWEYPSGADPMTILDIEVLDIEALNALNSTADYIDIAQSGDILIADHEGGQAEIVRIEGGQIRQIWNNCY